MISSLWNEYRYKAPISCLIDYQIREYDISKANISVLVEKGIITEETYQQLYAADRMTRQIFIGKLEGANPEVATALKAGVIEAKRLFFEANQIQDQDVLEIDNDAVFIVGNRPIIVQQVTPHINFRLANMYTSFYAVKNLRYYYYYNMISNTERLVIKGLTGSAHFHENYMLDFLKALFNEAQMYGPSAAISLLSRFYNNYVSRNLEIGYYRELNSNSGYKFLKFDMYSYTTEIYDPRMKKLIDISYNEKVLREFSMLLSSKYFEKSR